MTSKTVDVYGHRIEARYAATWQQAQALAQRRLFDSAATLLQRLLAEQPDFVPAMVQASHFLRMCGRYRDAEALALKAASVSLAPGLAVETGRLLRRFERPRELSDLFKKVDWASTNSGPLLVEAARLLIESGLPDPATALLDAAEAVEPAYPHQHYIRGSMLATEGDMRAARASLSRALSLAPGLPHAHWMLSVVAEPAAEDVVEDVTAIAALLQRAPPDSDARAYLGYALHNRLHRLGRHEEAWEALEQGMRARRARVPYRREQQALVFQALHELDMGALPTCRHHTADAPSLVFIVGMHRSGTSLLERVLAGSSSVLDGGETYAFPAQLRRATDYECSGVVDRTLLDRLSTADLASVTQEFRSYARWRAAGRPVLTEKLPSNFLLVGLIARLLPEARILHMQRDPIDTCFSNLRTFFGNAAAYSYDPLEIADYYLRYRQLMRHWHRVLPGRILDVDYARFTADPASEARRVLEFCGLDFDAAMLDVGRSGGRVATASVGAVRHGILKNRGGVWRPYAAHLQEMIDALEPAYAQ